MRYSDVLDRLRQQEDALLGRCLVAPSQTGSRLRIEAGALIWECPLKDPFDGWGLFRIGTDREAHLVREATLRERDLWAHGRPQRRVVLLERAARGPRMGWSDDLEQLITLRLADDLDDYETVLTVFDGAAHWSLGLDPHTHPSRAARHRARLHDLHERLRRKNEHASASGSSVQTISWRLENALALAEATLVTWRPDGRGYLVTWRKNDREITTWVNEKLGVEHAGTCLSGLDAEHDLVSLASLIDQAR